MLFVREQVAYLVCLCSVVGGCGLHAGGEDYIGVITTIGSLAVLQASQSISQYRPCI